MAIQTSLLQGHMGFLLNCGSRYLQEVLRMESQEVANPDAASTEPPPRASFKTVRRGLGIRRKASIKELDST